MNWIRLVAETVKWRALVYTVMNFDFNKTRRIPFIAEGLSRFERTFSIHYLKCIRDFYNYRNYKLYTLFFFIISSSDFKYLQRIRNFLQ